MSGMLQDMIETTLDNHIEVRYPHLKKPIAVWARVIRSEAEDEKYKITISILDKSKQPDTDYPEIPDVITNQKFQNGDIAVVLLLLGECIPYIIGRWDG